MFSLAEGHLRPARGEREPGAPREGIIGIPNRHFAMQHSSTPGLHEVDVRSLDPALRVLLFTDGTVTRTLEALTLRRISVEVAEHTPVRLPETAARYLDARPFAGCVRRRVTMRAATGVPAVFAESHIVPDRLPTRFLERLRDASHGIGGSIEQARLESRRELLWFRLGASPPWASSAPGATVLIRLYRIVNERRPALLIREAFAVERHLDGYRPCGWCAWEDRERPAVGAAMAGPSEG